MRERLREIFVLSSFLMGGGGSLDVHELSRQQCVTRKSSDFKDSFAEWKPSCLSVYLLALLIAGHTSHVTSLRFPQVNLSLGRSAACHCYGAISLGGVEIGWHIDWHEDEHNDTSPHIQMTPMGGVTAAVWPLTAC